jgi:hypothetical protein
MIAVLQGFLLALTALSLGLRTTSVIQGRVHPVARLVLAAIIGSMFVMTAMQIAMRNDLHDLGLGLLLSLSPVGVFDVLKWWFRWKRSRT